ncbi:hypothetical protein RND71_027500 [Anisodus tanguticus]|uniref:F-box domain-containing protein n=1 Tax=Anisodus tanguticus TaxID=243964 RepID=A0AAE1V1S5_9SOLA|nr:hypothetical protein RND71_027500 [Anisodus tanguticus]
MAASDDCRAFPEDLTKEILVRLPVKSLFRFKCACKKWYALIKSHSFIQQHLNCSKNKLLIYDYGAPDDDESPPISLTILDDQNEENNPQRFRGMTNLIGSMDGLFYLECEIDRELISCALWNPATTEVRAIPLPPPKIDGSTYYGGGREFGFGLDPLTNDYKVVHFYTLYFDTAVYSCSRDSWRIFRPKNFYKSFLSERKDVTRRTYGTLYLNGAYYWLLTGKWNILSFDFGSEVFEEIGGPDVHSVNSRVYGLILLDDSIAVLNTSCYDSSLILVTRASRLVSYNVRMKKTMHLGFRHLGLRRVPECGGCGVHCYKESLVTIKRREVADIFD